MNGEVPVIADRVLPVSPLPNAAFAATARHGRSQFTNGQRLRERDFNLNQTSLAGSAAAIFPK
jgi:hypothetical protein